MQKVFKNLWILNSENFLKFIFAKKFFKSIWFSPLKNQIAGFVKNFSRITDFAALEIFEKML